jgi:hypothetical protein
MSDAKIPDKAAFDEGAEADLTDEEALAMGRQVPRPVGKHPAIDDTVYGEVDGPETEDQYDANHVGPGEHV